jgi:hypothetical protein
MEDMELQPSETNTYQSNDGVDLMTFGSTAFAAHLEDISGPQFPTEDISSQFSLISTEDGGEIGGSALTPSLTRGSSIESEGSRTRQRELHASNAENRSATFMTTPTPGQTYSLPIRSAKPRKTLPKKFGTACTVCGSQYEADIASLREHLQKHLNEQHREHLCGSCGIGFIHRSDLERHLSAAKRGTCGYSFDHARPCTGHHPRHTQDSDVLTDHDQFMMCCLTRKWENAQLQLQISGLQQLQKLRDTADALARLSLGDIAHSRKNSLASLVYSLKSFNSDPRNSTSDTNYDVEALEKGSISNPFKITLRLYVARQKRLKELQFASEALGQAALIGDDGAIESFLSKGANIDHRSKHNGASAFTPLMLAATAGNLSTVKLLLTHGASMNMSDASGETALHKAFERKDFNIAKCLIQSGANSWWPGLLWEDLLNSSVAADRADFMNLFLERSIELGRCTPSEEARRLLTIAVRYNSTDCARTLTETGAYANAFSEVASSGGSAIDSWFHQDPICTAIKSGCSYMVFLLLHTAAKGLLGAPESEPMAEGVGSWQFNCRSHANAAIVLLDRLMGTVAHRTLCTLYILITASIGEPWVISCVLKQLSVRLNHPVTFLVEKGLDDGVTYGHLGTPLQHALKRADKRVALSLKDLHQSC